MAVRRLDRVYPVVSIGPSSVIAGAGAMDRSFVLADPSCVESVRGRSNVRVSCADPAQVAFADTSQGLMIIK